MIVHGQLEFQLPPNERLYDRINWVLLMISRARIRETSVIIASLGPTEPSVVAGYCRVPVVLVVEHFEIDWLGTYEVESNIHDSSPGARLVLDGVQHNDVLERIFKLTPVATRPAVAPSSQLQ